MLYKRVIKIYSKNQKIFTIYISTKLESKDRNNIKINFVKF